MQYIEIEYNQKSKPLETALSGVRQPGDFFVCGAIEMPMPRVEIEGAGTLSFPVPNAQIAAIVRRAELAPYGKGEATVVDTSVRKVWQISTGKINIGGKSWNANFENILSFQYPPATTLFRLATKFLAFDPALRKGSKNGLSCVVRSAPASHLRTSANRSKTVRSSTVHLFEQ